VHKSLPIDRIIGAYKEILPTAVLYFEFTAKCIDLYKLLRTMNMNIVLRYMPTEGSSNVYLSGYGVELAIKNTEYKVVDDDNNDDNNNNNQTDTLPTNLFNNHTPVLKKLDAHQTKSILV